MENYYYKKYRQVIALVSKNQYIIFSDDCKQAVKEKILSDISRTQQAEETISSTYRFSWHDWTLRSARFALVMLIIVGVGTGTSLAAASAQPGDILYPVKLISEAAQLSISVREEAKAELQAKIAERRLDENLQLQVYTVEIPDEYAIEGSETPNENQQDSSKSNNKSASAQANGAKHTIRNLTPEQAKAEAAKSEQRFTQALEALKRTQTKLEDKGSSRAAEAARANIQKLEERSLQLHK